MDKAVRIIDIFLFEQVNMLDVAGPAQVFHQAKHYGDKEYRMNTVTLSGKSVATSCGIQMVPNGKAGLKSRASDLLIPGGPGVDDLLQSGDLRRLISDWMVGRQNARVISICSGALLVANSGLLDGKQATTHWERTAQAQELFPDVSWRMNELYVQQGSLYSSAGVTAGIDLALAIVRRDAGSATALGVARELVVHMQRSGGQSQFSELLEAQFSATPAIRNLIEKLCRVPAGQWTLQTMADSVAMTPRTLSRKFSAQVGDSPVHYLEKIRVKYACDAICAGLPLNKVIDNVGFGDFQRMQRAFKRNLNTTIGEYQKAFVA